MSALLLPDTMVSFNTDPGLDATTKASRNRIGTVKLPSQATIDDLVFTGLSQQKNSITLASYGPFSSAWTSQILASFQAPLCRVQHSNTVSFHVTGMLTRLSVNARSNCVIAQWQGQISMETLGACWKQLEKRQSWVFPPLLSMSHQRMVGLTRQQNPVLT